ncbi:hypothetical protein O6H91_17G071400 [Diphasiastrum complanatum]|uniref:Uncharacterized protein n=1 Tax=Diphasiastrum complanatum TaxID=34168 RepID=A0ACC2B857_DIPCM|nr:hypothetical protein O6H91_17G071400 [Diphasiastrum complanatum]
MMQMLGFGGGGVGGGGGNTPKAKSTDGGAGVTPASPSEAAPLKAMRLVYYDEKGKFKMDAEAVAALQLAKEPLGVVAVCGRSRQGKSYILNQLLGRSRGFKVAPTHRPCTKGLWMWSAPLRRTAADGSEYNLLLLDSEGIDAYDQTGTYSTQIFSLAVLLSSMFVYNQMGGIDEAALDRLSLVTEMTKHIRVRASQKQTDADEMGQFSPVFLWLLRDFYLDLTEDGRKITPKEYLESALQPTSGSGKAISAKNEIRDSIRSLFPDRHCYALVRPMSNERELQKLDQVPAERLRPEFQTGLDHLAKFIFERTRPKQVGSIVMTGPILAGLTQSFLDAINAGAVPTIATSWQNVEENECRRAYDSAVAAYLRSSNDAAPADQMALQEAHDSAWQAALSVYNYEAVGAGPVRTKYERSLQNSLKKHFEEYKKQVSMQSELKCVRAIETMEDKLRAASHTPSATFGSTLDLLNGLLLEYDQVAFGSSKWQKLVKFLQQSLEGSLFDVVKRASDQAATQIAALELRCQSLEEKASLIDKQVDASRKDAVGWKRRYESAMTDYKSTSEVTSSQYLALQNKLMKVEEKAASLSQQLDATVKEAAEWRNKYTDFTAERRTEEERSGTQYSTLQSKYSAVEARLAAAREQAVAAKEEAAEWRRKHESALAEARTAIEKENAIRDRASRHAQRREDSLRVEYAAILAQKDAESREQLGKLDQNEHYIAELNSRLKDQDSKVTVQQKEIETLQAEVAELQVEGSNAKSTAQSLERELESTRQERGYSDERVHALQKRLEEAEVKSKVLEKEARRAAEEADKSRDAATSFEREKLEALRLAMERLAAIERTESHAKSLEREKEELLQEIERSKFKHREASAKAESLENGLLERDHEMEELLNSAHEQRSNTVHILESLLASERAAHAEASSRADTLSVQLQTVQSKLDAVQHELTTSRLNEHASETKIRTLQSETPRSRRFSLEDFEARVSAHNVDTDAKNGSNRKRLKIDLNAENGSSRGLTPKDSESMFGNEEDNASTDIRDSKEYLKFTIQKLKQDLTKAGHSEEILQLRNPSKKDLLNLYEKLILQK